MNQLFISYSYTGKQDNQIYQGFGNMIADKGVFPPLDINHIENLHKLTKKDCIDKLGMESATTIVLFWKELNGS